MKINRKFKIIAALTGAVTISVAAIKPPPPQDEFTNLKVLPKDISSKALQKIMVDEFQDGLGVGCNFCHAQEKGSLHLDYASDEKPEKEIARSMMLMTMDINKKYFGVEHPVIGDSILTISCVSCHHGTAHPDKTD
jgi:Photosynthetic reaction centre cytochrome C subunit